MLRAIEELGFKEPTPVQSQAIPLILQGGDLLAAAQTGTGKTAGFALPLLQHLMQKNKTRGVPRCLILTPTRELACQVCASVRALAKYLPLRSLDIYGGVDIMKQIRTLRKGVDILIATPGRLLDLIGQGAVELSQVESLVLDEADRMLDMGFIHDIRAILELLPKKRQSLLFSATFSDSIKKLAGNFLKSPQVIQIASQNSVGEGITETIHPVDSKNKQPLLSYLISSKQWRQVLVFVRTKHGADKLVEMLRADEIQAAAIHSNKSQGARTKALANFKRGTIQALVATDIAARGLDIDHLPYVVNFDLPNCAEDYVHRIGRTGRAGRKGEAISLVCIDEHKLQKGIERLLNRKITEEVVAGFEPDPSIKAKPIEDGRNRNRSRAPRQNSQHNRRSQGGPLRQAARSKKR